MKQKERRKEGDGESATETNVYEELIAAQNEKDVECGNAAGQEPCTKKINVCTDETTKVCEANSKGHQEVVVVETLYDNPGEGTSSRTYGNSHYENLSKTGKGK